MNDEQISRENLKENKRNTKNTWILIITLLIALTALILAIINYLWIGNIPGA
ncbi:MAG: hypothetical protein KGD59_10460 [Candidatus Heimdallarchaeota archaeon]|nr:hypothetical protein [Candidatus Heimdallarchaeota archaeon]MBY8994961.1 hypothetical protein [Candidatus Heimdallarchaeota archaeon]